jgi:hypothetical protein
MAFRLAKPVSKSLSRLDVLITSRVIAGITHRHDRNPTAYECHAGNTHAAVQLKGSVVKFANNP